MVLYLQSSSVDNKKSRLLPSFTSCFLSLGRLALTYRKWSFVGRWYQWRRGGEAQVQAVV